MLAGADALLRPPLPRQRHFSADGSAPLVLGPVLFVLPLLKGGHLSYVSDQTLLKIWTHFLLRSCLRLTPVRILSVLFQSRLYGFFRVSPPCVLTAPLSTRVFNETFALL